MIPPGSIWSDSYGFQSPSNCLSVDPYAHSGLQGDAAPGDSRGSFTALRYDAIQGIVRDARNAAEGYHWEDGPCWNSGHQSVTQRTLVPLSDV